MDFRAVLLLIFAAGVSSLPHRWNLVADGDGRKHLVDLNLTNDPEPSYDAMTDINYLLFTRRNPTEAQRITLDMDTVRNSNWNSNSDLRFVLHGWNGGPESAHNIFITRDLLAIADHNVIVIDWSAGSTTINYITARNRVAETGRAVAVLIDQLASNGFTSHSRINVIGHSLGSHVAGFMGKSVTGGRLNALFLTDPAGPLFNINDPDNRVEENDANYTEAIYTNAGTLGFEEPIAHANFYPNFGSQQPGCGTAETQCNHGRSNHLYSETLLQPLLIGRQCTGYEQIVARNCPGTGVRELMGTDQAKSIRGVYFLETNAESPFGRG